MLHVMRPAGDMQNKTKTKHANPRLDCRLDHALRCPDQTLSL